MKGGFTMLDFSLSILAMVIIFMVSALVLVKLYRHGVKAWMVHTVLTICALFYIAFRPFTLQREVIDVFIVFVLASIFVTEKPVSKKDYSDLEESSKEERGGSSLSSSIMSMVLLYGIFDFFDDIFESLESFFWKFFF